MQVQSLSGILYYIQYVRLGVLLWLLEAISPVFVVVCMTTRQGASNYITSALLKYCVKNHFSTEIMTTVITKSHNLSNIGI